MRSLQSTGKQDRLVWIYDEGVEGTLVGPMGAFFSMVKYSVRGNDYEILMENDDFMILGDE